jgi:hypothetical protein
MLQLASLILTILCSLMLFFSIFLTRIDFYYTCLISLPVIIILLSFTKLRHTFFKALYGKLFKSNFYLDLASLALIPVIFGLVRANYFWQQHLGEVHWLNVSTSALPLLFFLLTLGFCVSLNCFREIFSTKPDLEQLKSSFDPQPLNKGSQAKAVNATKVEELIDQRFNHATARNSNQSNSYKDLHQKHNPRSFKASFCAYLLVLASFYWDFIYGLIKFFTHEDIRVSGSAGNPNIWAFQCALVLIALWAFKAEFLNLGSQVSSLGLNKKHQAKLNSIEEDDLDYQSLDTIKTGSNMTLLAKAFKVLFWVSLVSLISAQLLAKSIAAILGLSAVLAIKLILKCFKSNLSSLDSSLSGARSNSATKNEKKKKTSNNSLKASSSPRKFIRLALVNLLILLAAIFCYVLLNVNLDAVTPDKLYLASKFYPRIKLWRNLPELLDSFSALNYLLGVGYDNYRSWLSELGSKNFTHIHNVYLHFFLQFGLVGLYFSQIYLIKLLNSSKFYTLGIFILIAGLFDCSLLFDESMFVLFSILAMLIYYEREKTSKFI